MNCHAQAFSISITSVHQLLQDGSTHRLCSDPCPCSSVLVAPSLSASMFRAIMGLSLTSVQRRGKGTRRTGGTKKIKRHSFLWVNSTVRAGRKRYRQKKRALQQTRTDTPTTGPLTRRLGTENSSLHHPLELSSAPGGPLKELPTGVYCPIWSRDELWSANPGNARLSLLLSCTPSSACALHCPESTPPHPLLCCNHLDSGKTHSLFPTSSPFPPSSS